MSWGKNRLHKKEVSVSLAWRVKDVTLVVLQEEESQKAGKRSGVLNEKEVLKEA